MGYVAKYFLKDITGKISTGDFAAFPQNLPVTFANVLVGLITTTSK